MIVLVDYDNINRNTTKLGIVHVVSKIMSNIAPADITQNRRVLIRLYGGWYSNRSFTSVAQNLSAEIQSNFPNAFFLSDNTTQIIVNCEIAYSILADPSNHLFNTFRIRGIPSGLKAQNPSTCGCTTTNCPIIATYTFIVNDMCSVCNYIKPKDIFYRGEQKLVDTMLTSDLIFLSNQIHNLCIVSSDDDFWPGIKTTLQLGKKIIHLHTLNRYVPSVYSRNTNRNYIQKIL